MMYSNETRFVFLQKTDIQSTKVVQKVEAIIKDSRACKPYFLDWDDILKKYNKLGIGDIDEFSFNYVFGYHALRKKLKNRISKEAMYIEVRSYLKNLKKKGQII